MGKRKRERQQDAVVQKASLGSPQNPSDTFVSLMGGAPSASGARVSDSSAMRVSAVYSCVRVIAEDGAKLKPQVWRQMPDGTRQPAREHPLYRILRAPHRHMTPVSLLLALFSAWGFRGNAIAVILRDRFGNPEGLWPIHPGCVTIFEAMDGRLFYAISRRTTLENAVLRDVPMMVPDYDVFHVRGMTFDGIVGLSPLAQLRESIGIAIAGEELSAKLMANGAQPTGVLRHPKVLTKDVADRLSSSWNGRHGGTSNAGKTVVLEEGMEFEALGMTSVDAQFLEQRKLTIEEIARGFRVPLHMIGMLDRMTNNNVEALTRAYYDQTLMPMLESFEAEFTRAFNLPEEIYVEFDVRRLLRADFKTRQEGNRTMFQSGALMPNEWRSDEGLNPTPAGNVFARPLNTAYVDDQGNVVAITPPGGKTSADAGADPNPEEPK